MKWNETSKKQPFTLEVSLKLTAEFKEQVKRAKCPACGQSQLSLDSYVQGARGWEATLRCENCNFHGVVNASGFEFIRVSSKGKAVERVAAVKASQKR